MARMVSLTDKELTALLQAAKQHSTRDWLLLLVTFSHGLRASEAVALTKADIRDGILTVSRLKGSLRTAQELVSSPDPLRDEARALPVYLDTLAKNELLFDITRYGFTWIMQRHCKTAGIPALKAHPHSLKHTCAMESIGSGIENVRQYLGHKSIASTGEYLKVTDAIASKNVQAAMRARATA